VPVRFLSEALGYKVEWDEENFIVTVSRNDVCNVLQIGSTVAELHLNDMKREVLLDVAPKILAGRTYVPLRYITESLGCGVLWHEEERAVYMSVDASFALEEKMFSMVQFTKTDAETAFGAPYDVISGADGIERYVYLRGENAEAMTVFGFYNNQLFEFFTNDTTVLTDGQQLSSDIEAKIGNSGCIFYDTLAGNVPVALFVSLGGKQYKPLKNEAAHDAVMAQEAKLAYYLTNALRRKAGAADLTYSTELSKVDQAHVRSMAKNNFFAHAGLEGDNIKDRITASGSFKNYKKLGEILARMPNAYHACYGWLNSKTHRSAMLDGAYEFTGICVDGNINENLYYAQVLVKL